MVVTLQSRSLCCAKIIKFCIIILATTGVLSPFSYNILPSNEIFEIALFLSALIISQRITRSVGLAALLFSAYVAYCYFYMNLFNPANNLDFLQSYKAYIYTIPLAIFCKKNIFTKTELTNILRTLLILFIVKYSYSRALGLTARLDERPGIFTENNYELIFILLLFYSVSESLGKYRPRYFTYITILVALSGSRSAALALAFMYPFVFIKKISLRTTIPAFFLVTTITITYLIFSSRMNGGIEEIDRYRFLMVFMSETHNWPFFRYIIGSPPLTALQPDSCSTLSYYQTLFSYAQDGKCYSVILHSYILRAVFDQGLIGLTALYSFLYLALLESNYKRKDIACVIGIITASALSVSALNSIYVCLGLALILSSHPSATNNHVIGTNSKSLL